VFVPVDRVLCVAATLFGIGAFLFALRTASNPMGLHGSQLGWALAIGIICLIVGLSITSLAAWRGGWCSEDDDAPARAVPVAHLRPRLPRAKAMNRW
jgi:hypothetical protein